MDGKQEQQKSSVPPPPEPEITIRTVESDIKSLEQSGGASVVPQAVPLKFERSDVESYGQSAGAGIGISGYGGSEQPIFSPTSETAAGQSSSKTKLIMIIVGIFVIGITFWLIGYYVISPWLFPKQMPTVQPSQNINNY